jgi:hypothetical protein
MPRRFSGRALTSWVLLAATTAALCLVPCRTVAGPLPAEPGVEAAFLFNIAKFTEWPAAALPAEAPIRFCVASAAVARVLETIVAGRLIGRHPLLVLPMTEDAALASCQVVDLGGVDAERVRPILAALRGIPVLSVGEGAQFTAMGGVARILAHGGTVRLTINVVAANRARLRIDSRLLNLATIVGDGALEETDAEAR